MGCLYCGKEIGAFRLLRDSEFCSALHHAKYGARLGKALQEISAPEPAPAGIANFREQMPLQKGNFSSTLHPWQSVIRAGADWPLRIDTSDATANPKPSAPSAPAAPPPRSELWMSTPPAEPVAAFVAASAALAPEESRCIPNFAAALGDTPVLNLALCTLAPCERWMPGEAAEPVAAFVQSSAALSPVHSLCLPGACAELESVPFRVAAPPACQRWLPGEAPEPVAAFVQSSAALSPVHSLCLPGIGAELEPVPFLDLQFAAPPACQRWMPAPEADPVWSYLQASIAPVAHAAPAWQAPAFALTAIEAYVPWIAQVRQLPRAEAAMAMVRPSTSITPVAPNHQATMALPVMPPAGQVAFAAAMPPAAVPAPEAVERWLVAAQAAVPLMAEHELCPGVESDRLPAALESTPAFCKPVASPAPEAVESLIVPSAVGLMASAAAPRLLPFTLAASRELALPSPVARQMTATASLPEPAAPRLGAPQPIATVALTPPATTRRLLESALPRRGLLPLEFHSHRLRSSASAHPEWKAPRLSLLPPRFLLGAILEKLDDPNRQKPAPKPANVVTLPNMPAGKRPPAVWMVAGRIAAGFLLTFSLWFGVANFRGDHRLAAREENTSGDTTVAADNGAGASGPNTATQAQPQPKTKGPLAWVRQTVAERASLKIAENFRGMENWDGAAKARPDGWSRHRDGYVNAGALAVFRPTLRFTDYHMEFMGQIEAKSIGWTVRATDASNYHAMKLTVVEAGIRPFVALVHYDVVGGKPGRRTQTPLNVMVHNNQPLQFAVDVRGNRVVTSIDGEEVDSFVGNTLVAGGVGFFSEAGERARLYWMRISRNDDWLGHVCAMLAEETGAGVKAELREPELPGVAPVPGLPANRDGMTLAAVWIGLPYLGTSRKTRLLKTWRSKLWNT